MAKEKNESKGIWKINKRLLHVKLHYLMFYAGIGAIYPYLSLNAQQLGLTATAVGIVYTILPFTYIISKPIIGAISDYFHNMKTLTSVLLVITAIVLNMTLLISPMERTKPLTIPMICKENSTQLVSTTYYNSSCFSYPENLNSECSFRFQKCGYVIRENNDSFTNRCNNLTGKEEIEMLTFESFLTVVDSGFIEVTLNNHSLHLCSNISLQLDSCNSSLPSCLHEEKNENKSIYVTVQFWSFASIMFIASTTFVNAQSITDAACYELLGDDSELYGRQRLWGTIGVGTASLIAGFLFDTFSEDLDNLNYAPGFYIMLIMTVLDLFFVFKIDLKQIHSTEDIFKNVGRVFTSMENIIFAIMVFLNGILTPLVLRFEIWYLKDLGASQFLMGLSIAFECLLAEVPFFFISGKIIKKLGHFYCLISTFAAYMLRFTYYYFLVNPWYVLPIELLHGITYGVFFATITSYAHSKTPKGAEATMFGVLGGLYDGLGTAVGSILAGFSYDRLGGRQTFLIAAIFCFASMVIFLFIHFAFKSFAMRNVQQNKVCIPSEQKQFIDETEIKHE